jgi:hypothetical protein
MKTVQFTMTDELHQRLKETAWNRRKTQADTLRAVLDETLLRSATAGEGKKVDGAAR